MCHHGFEGEWKLNRLKTAELPTFAGGGIMTYTYDSANQRTGLESPSGRFTYTYDLAGRMSSLVNPEGERTTFTYDNAGQRTSTRLANGTRESITYNSVGSIQRVANIRSDGTTISSYLYSYNAGESRIAEIWEDGTRVTWTYDNAYRLTNELRPGTNGFHITHTYDPVGNRTKKTEDGVDTDYTYNAGNQIVTEVTGGSRTTYTFDGAGNQETVETASSRTTMIWDFENRRTKHETGVIVFEDQYDADGRRFRERFAIGATEQYVRKHVWDQENVLYETDGSNVIQVAYTLEPALYGNLISQRKSGATSYYHFDALGSARQLTDSLAAILSSYDYKAYGEPAPGSSSATLDQPYTYVARLGYYTGICPGTYIRARWYEPRNSLWISEDPLRTSGESQYRYALNSPIVASDPSGNLPSLPRPELKIYVLEKARALNDCGAAFFQVMFLVFPGQSPIQTPLNGWILQHVKISADIRDCKGRKIWPANRENEFTEGWQVVNGIEYRGFQKFGNKPLAIDTFKTVSEGYDTKGTITIKGIVKFEPDYKVDAPPWGFAKEAGGNLPTIARTPSDWVESGQEHSMTVSYDCCCNPYVKPVVVGVPK